MDTQTHKMLDFLEHLWPYISGIVVTMLAGIRLWWYDRKETKKQIQDQGAAIVAINENMVTHDQLHQCREDVRGEDKEILGRIEELIKDNAQQHAEIQREISDTLKHIGRLHSDKK